MTQTTYEILALLERHFEESVTLLKQLTTCPGQRSDILIPLANELRYVWAQIGFEVTEQASDLELGNMTHWSCVHRKDEMRIKDPDDVYVDVEEREELRKKKGLPPRVIVLPWSYEEEEKLLAAKRSEARKRRKQNQRATKSPRPNR
jgi:hypothetical protein